MTIYYFAYDNWLKAVKGKLFTTSKKDQNGGSCIWIFNQGDMSFHRVFHVSDKASIGNDRFQIGYLNLSLF